MTRVNARGREYIVSAFLGLGNDDAEILAIFHDKLYELGQIIKQRDPELFDEIIRTFVSAPSMEKIKVKLNRSRRTRN